MCNVAVWLSRERSLYCRVVEGSYFVLCEEVYSETRRKPKKAVVMAAQSISLSSYTLDDANKLFRIVNRVVGVMGCRLGIENFLPCALLIPFMSVYRRVKSRNWTCEPCMVVKCFMAARGSLTFLCELYDETWVAYNMRFCSVGGLCWRS